MKLMVNHQTHYRYTQVARNSVQSIKMMPQVLCTKVEVWHISVPGQYSCQRDAFNNLWITATQRHEYRYHLTIMAQGVVDLYATELGYVENWMFLQFLQRTKMTCCDQDDVDFAQAVVKVQRSPAFNTFI